MPRATYDTRFFVEHYYSGDALVTDSTTNEIRRAKEKAVSSIVLHEVYRLTLQNDGRQTARLRTGLPSNDFKVIPADEDLAATSGELRQDNHISLADSIIAASASPLRAVYGT